MEQDDVNDVQAELKALAPQAVALDGGEPLTPPGGSAQPDGLTFAPPSEDALTADPEMKGALMTAAMMIVPLAMPNWQVTPEEMDAVCEQGARTIQHYFPHVKAAEILKHPALGLTLAVSAVALPRIAMKVPMREKPEPDDGDTLSSDDPAPAPENTLKEGALNER
ncbi:hypothetical protein O1O06_11840 [Grimontia hollisae]|uniref:hypothetical protein n=1 Tax=Grimontia hollisae TaxID=673 RepID=UPI0023DA348A|nr:hypothetical protein [Grimontia hollisae]MDF2185454.1 hypothetical protein [Grimontia hollisae]